MAVNKMYKVLVDARWSDEFIVKAKDANEAKKIAIRRFFKLKNFNAWADEMRD